ncbi:hypothetical protein D3C80_1384840 [compost metagenome]
MFSSTTMASSTTNPVAMVSAISDRLLRLKSHRYMAANVPISETGTATAGISVARPERRNRNTTRITSAMEITSVCSTSSSEARIVGERSWAICRSMAAGIVSCSSGRRARMLFTVWIILASGSLRIISKMAGLALVIPRIVGERSCAICRSIAAGIVSWSSGSRARMLFTVWIILASGSLRIISKIAGLALVIPALRTSWTESVTLATSLKRTAAPLL